LKQWFLGLLLLNRTIASKGLFSKRLVIQEQCWIEPHFQESEIAESSPCFFGVPILAGGRKRLCPTFSRRSYEQSNETKKDHHDSCGNSIFCGNSGSDHSPAAEARFPPQGVST
jgi:hypothetical protein